MANSSDTVSMLGRVRSLSHHCHVSCEQVAARVEATLSFTAMTRCCDIVAAVRSLSLGAMNLSPAAMPLLRFLDFFQPKQQGTVKEQRTLPLYPLRQTVGGPGFPRRRRCRRLIISCKNSKNSERCLAPCNTDRWLCAAYECV